MMGFCIFGEEMVCLEIAHAVKTTKVYLLSVGHVRVQFTGKAFECRSRGRRFNCARFLLHYNWLLVERL